MTDSRSATGQIVPASSRREATQPALDCDLMSRVLDRSNMQRAWKQVRANRGAPGIDRMTVEEFPGFARVGCSGIRESLRDGSYAPQPVRQKAIPKPGGGERLLGIRTVTDRVIQQAIAQVLTPMFDPHFSESSFGFRPGRSAHGAVTQIQRYIGNGRRFTVDLDLEKFFDRVNHDVLMLRVTRRVRDVSLLRLIGRYLRSGVVVDGQKKATWQGVLQGSPLSPLLANILLDDFDKELERRGHTFARYADDEMIVVGSEKAGQRVMASISHWLSKHLRLQVNANKSQVAHIIQVAFLGFRFGGKKICWTSKTIKRFKQRVREITRRTWGVSMKRRLRELSRYIVGWMGYFRLSEHYRPTPELDKWIRRRLRMCVWRQWRRIRTRIRKLIAGGVPKSWAIRTGMSAKGPWHMSRNRAIHAAIGDEDLANLGLVSVEDLWVRFHYPQ